eukprot:6173176-Pleurochrysis_carterae.AAC.1
MAFDNGRERGAGCRELLYGPAMLHVMQEREERNEVIGGAKGSCEGEIHKPWHRARRNGQSKDGSVDKAECVESSGVEHRSEGRTVPSRQATSARRTVRQQDSCLNVESVRLGTAAKATRSAIQALGTATKWEVRCIASQSEAQAFAKAVEAGT